MKGFFFKAREDHFKIHPIQSQSSAFTSAERTRYCVVGQNDGPITRLEVITASEMLSEIAGTTSQTKPVPVNWSISPQTRQMVYCSGTVCANMGAGTPQEYPYGQPIRSYRFGAKYPDNLIITRDRVLGNTLLFNHDLIGWCDGRSYLGWVEIIVNE